MKNLSKIKIDMKYFAITYYLYWLTNYFSPETLDRVTPVFYWVLFFLEYIPTIAILVFFIAAIKYFIPKYKESKKDNIKAMIYSGLILLPGLFMFVIMASSH